MSQLKIGGRHRIKIDAAEQAAHVEPPTVFVDEKPTQVLKQAPLAPSQPSAAMAGGSPSQHGQPARMALLDNVGISRAHSKGGASAAYDALTVARGERAFERQLARTRDLVARGVKVVWAFDLDNTLYDTRARTLSIGRSYDEQHGTNFFARVAETDLSCIGRNGSATAEAMGIPQPHADGLAALWDREFWNPERVKFDLEIPEVMERARRILEAGGSLRYITGRAEQWVDPETGKPMSFRADSLERIKRSGLPADDALLMLKPGPGGSTPQFKKQALQALQAQDNTVVCGFVTDTLHELLVMHHVDALPCFWVRTSYELASKPSTPPWVYSLPQVM